MEKNIKSNNIDIVIKAQKGAVVFEIKDHKLLNESLLNDIKQDYFLLQKDSIVIYPEQQIIESQKCFIEEASLLI